MLNRLLFLKKMLFLKLITFPMNCLCTKINLCLVFAALPLLTQCGGDDPDDDTFYCHDTPDDTISITEADLQTLQSGDSVEISEKDQLLVIKITGSNQANLKFLKVKGNNKPLEGSSSSLTWQAQGAGSFIYTLTIESTNIQDFGKFTAIIKILPDTAKQDSAGKVTMQTELQSIHQSTLPPHGDPWIKPTILVTQQY